MSSPRYESYRDSGVEWLGEVPSHWNLRRIGNYFSERRERVSDKDFLPLSVTKNGVVPQLETAAKTDDGDNRKKVISGDFVINSRSDRRGSSGLSLLTGSVSLINTVLQFKPGLKPEFVNYLLRSENFQNEYYRFGRGIVADLWSTNFSEMRNIVLPEPTAEEQNCITVFLDQELAKLDGLIDAQKCLIELLKDKRQAVISHAVTKGLDPTAPMKPSGLDWPIVVPAHWEVLPLTRVVAKFVDYRGATPNKVNDGVPLITATQIKHGRIDHTLDPAFISEIEYESRMTRGFPTLGDLLLTTEAPLGEAALIDDERVAPGQRMILMKVRPSKITSSYLLMHFRSLFGQKELWTRASGSTASGIRADRLRASQVLVPPLPEQVELEQFIHGQTAHFEDLEQEVNAAVLLLQERRAALISAAVTGKIDVRGIKQSVAEAA